MFMNIQPIFFFPLLFSTCKARWVSHENNYLHLYDGRCFWHIEWMRWHHFPPKARPLKHPSTWPSLAVETEKNKSKKTKAETVFFCV